MTRWLALALGTASGSATAQILTLTEDQFGANQVPLGYPVPLPIESQTPVDGFRAYAPLRAHLADLALAGADVTEIQVGQSLNQRPIYAYRLGDADALTVEGLPEPAALINGTIHAREWASPEVSAALIERFAERADDGGLYRYLLDNLNVVVVPVLNVDGLLQTQRYPTQMLQTEYSGDPQPDQQQSEPEAYRNYPRDGRFRRKNMNGVDEVLCAAGDAGCTADGMNGVDLNRNNTPYFGSGNQNSGAAGALLYRGTSAASEPETQALDAAAALGPTARLRLFIDIHSFSRVYFGVDTGNTRRDAIARSVAQGMAAATGAGNRYPYSPSPAGYGIGSTDEHFGYGYQIPAYTLEIEPSANGGIDYGSFGYHHDGFVLPADQIARVRQELTAATTLGLYRMAGPPLLRQVRIERVSDGHPVFVASWQRDGNQRRQTVETRETLSPQVEYRLWLAFNKPMRVRNASGAVVQYTGQSADPMPSVAITGADASGSGFSHPLDTSAGQWLGAAGNAPSGLSRYADDSYTVTFSIPDAVPVDQARRVGLAVGAEDFAGQALDANPRTIGNWDGGWTGYEDSQGNDDTDSGGVDVTMRIVDDGSPLPGQSAGSSGGGGAFGGGSLLLLAGLGLGRYLRRWRHRRR